MIKQLEHTRDQLLNKDGMVELMDEAEVLHQIMKQLKKRLKKKPKPARNKNNKKFDTLALAAIG